MMLLSNSKSSAGTDLHLPRALRGVGGLLSGYGAILKEARCSICNTVAARCLMSAIDKRGDNMTALLDWFTGTFVRTRMVEAHEPRILKEILEGKDFIFQGYKGKVKDGFAYAVSYDEKRAMVQGSGYDASRAAGLFAVFAKEGASVSRIDVQVTFAHHNADAFIAMIQPAKTYQAYRIERLDARGSTLYIGAPKSRVRMRIYNKTAESGMRPNDDLEYVRVEIQMRDSYADRAYKAFREGQLDALVNYWAAKMLNEVDQEAIACFLSTSNATTITSMKECLESTTERRKAWFESTVVPAMRKVLHADPSYLDVMVKLLTEGGWNGINDSEDPSY